MPRLNRRSARAWVSGIVSVIRLGSAISGPSCSGFAVVRAASVLQSPWRPACIPAHAGMLDDLYCIRYCVTNT